MPALPRLRLAGITKTYPGVVANDAIDLAVLPGEIHALLGENGAGKSTLMKIIYGVIEPDAGTIFWNDAPVAVADPARGRKLGIGMVFQHFSLFETLTVAENIALALEPGQVDAALPARIRDISARYGLALDPHRHVHSMTVGERQRVEIVRCLLQQPKLIILDEPTSVLTPQAVESLFATLRTLAAEGCSILYISHKLDEIRALCDRATVLRDGKVTGECDPRAVSSHALAAMMIGGDLPRPRHREARADGEPLLVIRQLSLPPASPFGTALAGVDLTVRAGEIVGIAGVTGNGQRELLAALSGERTIDDAAAIVIDGIPAGRLDAGERRALGMSYVPEERMGHGAVPEMSLAENALLTAYDRGMVRHGMVRSGAARAYARAVIDGYDVRALGPDVAARSLSGGNLQKFIVGRELMQNPKVLVAAQPTWGVDVGASAQIRQALLDLRDAGAAVLIVSEDLDELIEISDYLAVIARGQLSSPVPTRETNAEAIGLMMSGSFAVLPAPAATDAAPSGG